MVATSAVASAPPVRCVSIAALAGIDGRRAGAALGARPGSRGASRPREGLDAALARVDEGRVVAERVALQRRARRRTTSFERRAAGTKRPIHAALSSRGWTVQSFAL